jgi:putative aldouronate transport system substrate-binding protein
MTRHSGRITSLTVIALAALLAAGSSWASGGREEPGAAPGAGAVAPAGGAAVEPLGKYDPAITMTSVAAVDATIKFNRGEDMRNNVWTRSYADDLGIKLSYKWIADASEAGNKMQLAIAANDIPDVFMVNPVMMKQLWDNDMIADLTDVFGQWALPELKALYQQDPVGLKSCTIGGRMVGLAQTDLAAGNAPMLWIRNDWLRKLGLAEPKTTQDMLAVAKAFTERDPDGDGKKDTFGLGLTKGLWSGYADFAGFANAFHAYPNIWTTDASGKVVFGSIQPAMKDALAAMAQLYRDGLVDPEFGVKDAAKVAEETAAGRIGMAYGAWYSPSWPLNANRAKDITADWTAYAPLSVDAQPGKAQYSNAIGSYIVVNRKYAHPEAPVKMVNYWVNLFKKPTIALAGKYMVNLLNSSVVYYKYTMFIAWEPMGNIKKYRAISAALAAKDPAKLNWDHRIEYDGVQKFLKDPTYVEGWQSWTEIGPRGSLGVTDRIMQDRGAFNLFYGAATQTMADVLPTLLKLQDETFTRIIMGAAPLADFDRFVQDWNDLGGAQMTAEVNAWYAKNR